MRIATLQDVKLFIHMLDTTECLWHADDDATDCLLHIPMDKREAIQELMDQAIEVCSKHNASIWDFYPNLDEE